MRARSSRLELVAAGAAIVALAIIAALVTTGTDTNYDLEWALSWGRALLDGQAPGFTVDGAPTQHPLTNIVAALADPAPGDARETMRWLAYLAYGLLVVCTAMLAAELFSVWAGAVAGVAIALSAPALNTSAIAFQDVTAAALIVLAVLLEARQPRRGVAPLVALAAGGLLRPEIWGLAIAYLAVQLPERDNRERAGLALLALAGPLLWMASELLFTGNPLTSFTRTKAGAAIAQRDTGLGSAPGLLIDHLRTVAGRWVFYGGLLGTAAAAALAGPLRGLAKPGREPPAGTVFLTIGTLGLTCLAFLCLGAAELSLLERYVFAPAALLAVFLGYAVTVWLDLRPRGLVWAAAMAAALLVVDGARSLDGRRDRFDADLEGARTQGEISRDLRAFADRVKATGCSSVAVGSYRTRPYLAYGLDRQPGEVALVRRTADVPRDSAYVVPATRHARDTFELLGRRAGPLPPPPPGSRRRASSEHWTVYSRGC